MQFGRAFRPTQLMRIVEPIDGTPRIAVVCEPRLGWSKEKPSRSQGSHHVRFEGFASQLRLTTDIPLSYLGGQPFTLTGRQHLVLTWGAPIRGAARAFVRTLLERDLPLLAALGETVRHPSAFPAGSDPLRADAEATLL